MGLAKFLAVERIESNVKRSNSANTVKGAQVARDTECKASQEKYALDKLDFVLTVGIIIDTIPYTYTYRVSTQLVGMPIVCSVMQTSATGSMMAAGTTAYTVGTYVVVAYSSRINKGIILGAFDRPQGLEEYNIKSNISPNIRVHDEVTDKGILINTKEGRGNGSMNASQLKFEEHNDVPEWGMAFMSGMRWFVNPYISLIGVNDYTGISLFECDSLLRLSGINMQTRTSGSECEWLNDNGEYIEYNGKSLHPWEQYGCYFKQSTDVMEKVAVEEWHTEGSTIPFYRPKEKLIRPFHRIIDFGGWLGQGELTQILAPPSGDDIFAQFRKNDDSVAVARTHVDIIGNTSIRSMGDISITKNGIIAASSRINRPDEFSSKYGDNEGNYSNESIQIPTYLKPTGTKYTPAGVVPVLGIYDNSGFAKNWRDIFQLAYHTGDYYTPEEKKLKSAEMGEAISAPDYSELNYKHYLQDSKTTTIKIDDKRSVEYSSNEAGIHILKEGGIVIYDGFGSEIRMSHGSITISCAGDINIRPGRTTNIWSGSDTILRSNNATDISTTKGSVRIKAEANLELLGANDKKANHGVIIESKSSGLEYDFSELGDEIITNGIVLKAENSNVVTSGDLVYLRSGCGDKIGSGVFIDAGRGKSVVYVNANNVNEYITNEHTINFSKNGEVEKTTEFTKNNTLLIGPLTLTDSIYMDGDVTMAKNLRVCETISSFGNQSGDISPIGVGTRDTLLDQIHKKTEFPLKKRPKANTETYTTVYTKMLYDEKRVGNNEVLKDLGFSFRTDDQLKLGDDYLVLEDLWQQIQSYSTTSVNEWEESKVENTAGITYPYPGKKKYEQPIYVTQEIVIADFKNGVYTDRNVTNNATSPSDQYKNEKYGDQNKVSLNTYKVIKKFE